MQVKLRGVVFMWPVAVRKTIMWLEHNLSFVFSPIVTKQFLILPHKDYSQCGVYVSVENDKQLFGCLGIVGTGVD